jgi:hypothetical protein
MRPATGEHFASGQETSADRRTAWWAREAFRNPTNSMACRVPLCRVVPLNSNAYFGDSPTDEMLRIEEDNCERSSGCSTIPFPRLLARLRCGTWQRFILRRILPQTLHPISSPKISRIPTDFSLPLISREALNLRAQFCRQAQETFLLIVVQPQSQENVPHLYEYEFQENARVTLGCLLLESLKSTKIIG